MQNELHEKNLKKKNTAQQYLQELYNYKKKKDNDDDVI